LVLPVYWYCPKGTYDPKNPGCRAILDEIANRTAFLNGEMARGGASLSAHKTTLAKRAAAWDDLSTGSVSSSLSFGQGGASPLDSASLSNLLQFTSRWAQAAPYNFWCPAAPASSANSTLVGCVATAMAQIMYYWKWPIHGSGTACTSYSYGYTSNYLEAPLETNPHVLPNWGDGRLNWMSGTLMMTGVWDDSVYEEAKTINTNSDFRDVLKALYDGLPKTQDNFCSDLGNATYHWDQMKDICTYDDTSGYEAAQLSYHAGLAVRMAYGLDASTSSTPDVPGALTTHFRYDPTSAYGEVDANQIVNEIQWLRPVIMRGDGPAGGHCWVIYGYNQQTSPWQFEMNMGWGPGGQDWPGWYSFDTVPQGITNKLAIVTKVAPLDVVKFVGASGSGNGSPGSPYQNVEEALANAPNNTSTLIFQAQSVNTFSAATLYINRPLTLKGIQVTITK
jgi:hypothetical protein